MKRNNLLRLKKQENKLKPPDSEKKLLRLKRNVKKKKNQLLMKKLKKLSIKEKTLLKKRSWNLN